MGQAVSSWMIALGKTTRRWMEVRIGHAEMLGYSLQLKQSTQIPRISISIIPFSSQCMGGGGGGPRSCHEVAATNAPPHAPFIPLKKVAGVGNTSRLL